MTAEPRWHAGCVVDVPYVEPIFPELCPAWLSMVCVLSGQPPIDRSRPFAWAELGCGPGLSACMVAAANDDVEVWACDFNPAHVERARSLARTAGLTNCVFEEASFEDTAMDLGIGPRFVDVIVVHGVYSWVSPANQQHIVEFVRRRLRPGGLVYISYNAPTGWGSMVPLAEAIRLHIEADGRRSDLGFSDALAMIQRLADGGAPYFPLGPQETRELAELSSADARYAVHEYVVAHYQPMMFDKVAEALADARCSFVSSTGVTDRLSDLWVPPALAELVMSTTDLALREMLRDLVMERQLRRDLFRRGLASSSNVERDGWLYSLLLLSTGKELAEGAMVAVPVGEVTLDVDFYAPLVEGLQHGPLTVAQLCELQSAVGRSGALSAVSLLVGGGYAAPAVDGWPATTARESAQRLSKALIAENLIGAGHRSLIAAGTGSAVSAEYVEMLAIGALWDGTPRDLGVVRDYVRSEMARQGRAILHDGRLIDDADRAQAIIDERIAAAWTRADRELVALGVC